MTDVMEQDPAAVVDPVARARLLFTQWHVDEATGATAAASFAERLLDKLRQYGLTVVPVPQAVAASSFAEVIARVRQARVAAEQAQPAPAPPASAAVLEFSEQRPYQARRGDLSGVDLCGTRLPDGQLQLGADPDGMLVPDWPAFVSLGPDYPVFSLEEVRGSGIPPGEAGAGAENGVYA